MRKPVSFTIATLMAGLVLFGQYPDAYEPLKSGDPEGLGQITTRHVGHRLLGVAFVDNAEYPDLFARGRDVKWPWVRLPFSHVGKGGAPVFKTDIELRDKQGILNAGACAMLQTPDGVIHFITRATGTTLAHWTYDAKDDSYQKHGSVKIPKQAQGAASIGAYYHADTGALDVFFELTAPESRSLPILNTRSDDWYPYDGYGADRRGLRRAYAVGVTYPSLLGGEPGKVYSISARLNDVYYGFMSLNGAVIGGKYGLLTGSRFGEFRFYERGEDGFVKKLASDPRGVALRHRQINSNCVYYKSKQGDLEGIVAGGEGPIYFYKNAHKTNTLGAPVFEDPVALLQTDGYLYAGSLATPCVVDWDGDGVLDILTGASEGTVRFFKNTGSNEEPKFLNPVFLHAGGALIQIEAGYSGSLQGTTEARWGYITPSVIDWNGDGLPDLTIGDIRGEYFIYMNEGTPTQPKLAAARPLYCDGLNLKGRWRCGAALADVDGRKALMILDIDDQLHLYWRIDDYNLEDGGIVKMDNGQPIGAGSMPGGGSGRLKLTFYDWDGDGKLDIIAGAGRGVSLPDKISGYPRPTLGDRPPCTVLFVKNIGTNAQPVYLHPVPFMHREKGVVHSGGAHETGPCASRLGSKDGKPTLLICGEAGRLYLLKHEELFTQPHSAKK